MEQPSPDGLVQAFLIGEKFIGSERVALVIGGCKGAKTEMNDEQMPSLNLFLKTMPFYTHRDMNKAKAEDKHLFRVDELMSVARAAGLELTFYANKTFEHFDRGRKAAAKPDRFGTFFRDHLLGNYGSKKLEEKIIDQCFLLEKIVGD